MVGAYKEIDATTLPIATDGLDAPLVYADAIRGMAIGPETTKFNLIQFRENAQTGATTIVVGATITMPTSQIPAWAEYLTAIAAKPPFAEGEGEPAGSEANGG